MTKEESLLNLLRQIKEVLDEHNVEFWLECGTLLGAVRDDKFIPWEKDLDFGAWSEKVNHSLREKIADSLRQKGLKVWIAEDHINIKKEEVHGDINFYHLNGDTAIMPMLAPKNVLGRFLGFWKIVLMAPEHQSIKSTQSPGKGLMVKYLVKTALAVPRPLRRKFARSISSIYKRTGSVDISWTVPSRFFSQLSTLKFYGMQFKVPGQPQDYLAYRYGRDWEVPKKDYDGITDDRSFAINRQI